MTQRLANNYPLWTKIRQDPSTLGQRMLSAFGETNDFFIEQLNKIALDKSLNKKGIGLGNLRIMELEEVDHITSDLSNTGLLKHTYPTTVEGIQFSNTYELERVDLFDEFLTSPPDRFSISNIVEYDDLVIWSSNVPQSLNALSHPEYLVVEVKNSTLYNKRTSTSDRYYNNQAVILLEGLDANNNRIVEVVNILDDGVYVTRNIFSSLTKVPKHFGFDGEITIGYRTADMAYITDLHHFAVLTDMEGPLHLFIEEGFLTYATKRLIFGRDYRNGGEVQPNQEFLGFQVLADADGNNILPVELAIDPWTGHLYVLDDQDDVHVYNHGLNAFSIPQNFIQTSSSPMTLIPLQPYAKLNATERMWTYHKNPRDKITSITIRRVDPSGSTEYLQSDKTWGGSVYDFSGELLASDAVSSWQDFDFENEYDQEGQWDFYITTSSAGREYTYHTAVLVDKLVALKTIATGIVNTQGMFFSHNGNLVVYNNSDFYYLERHSDVYFADPNTQQLVFKTDYDSVEIT